MNNKVKNLDELAEIVHNLKEQGKTVVQCHGCFDLMHLGHIKHFEAAKKLGDILIISITADEFVNKGPGRPAFPGHLRAESLAALECVDYVTINPAPNGVEILKALKPNIYAKGSEYEKGITDMTRTIYREAEAVRSVGGVIEFTHEPTFSSTNLLKNHFNIYPDNVKEFLNDFSRHHTVDEILSKIKSIKDMKVLFIGEAVIDEYHYCHALGKSGKENLIAMKYKNEESFAGGVFACVNHLAGFCDNVDLVTCLGNKDSREDFIRKNLKPNINTKFFYRDDAC
ncbi:MAG: adenylyltransferase/cytidyltransferase family protein, partial [Parcubacteria group bacterium]|nr:adenylyltransferase/cytidyltransferase family protein [Parcubacteria group bacterium]